MCNASAAIKHIRINTTVRQRIVTDHDKYLSVTL